MITIVVADDHPVVRQGLRALLDHESDFSVIGEAGDGPEAVERVERLRPGVLVLDWRMPGLSGLEVTRQTHRRSPQTRVVILSMYANEAYVNEALTVGAAAYVLKQSTSAELGHAIREAVAGRRYLSPPLAEDTLEAYVHKAKATLDPYQTLTAREREVLPLVAQGLTSAEVASRLSISPRTVEMHRSNLMHKLDLHNQSELVRYALQRVIMTLEE